MQRPDTVFSVADVTASSCTGGEVRVNLGNATTGVGIAAEVPIFGIDGFISVPNDATPAGAAQALYFQDGNQKRVAGTRDNRWVSATGSPKQGDRFLVSNCAARVMLKRASSSVTIYTENQDDSNSSMILDVNGQKGTIRMTVGQSYFIVKKDKIQIGCGGSCFEISAHQIAAFGEWFAANVAGGNLGVVGVVPPPIGISSILAGPTGISGAPSTKWTVAV